MKGRHAATSKVGLALAGGGPEGSIYEIGAIRALDEALEGLDFNRLPVYVGVSAGAFIAACLANGLTSDQMCRAKLWANRRLLEPMLARHGVRLRLDVLADPDRDLWHSVGTQRARPPDGSAIATRLDRALDLLGDMVESR